MSIVCGMMPRRKLGDKAMNSNATSSAAPSTLQEGSFELNSECFRYTKSHSKDHEKEYKALKVKFNYCGETGHNEKFCKKQALF